MPTATKTKPVPETAVPVTFDEINRRRVRERIEEYRGIVSRRAAGEMLSVADMERAGELLDLLGLPLYTFDRDCAAMKQFTAGVAKQSAAADAAPGHLARAAELVEEIESTRKRLEALREEHRVATAKSHKAEAYRHGISQLRFEHPHVLAEIDDAVNVRIEELDRRRRVGGAA